MVKTSSFVYKSFFAAERVLRTCERGGTSNIFFRLKSSTNMSRNAKKIIQHRKSENRRYLVTSSRTFSNVSSEERSESIDSYIKSKENFVGNDIGGAICNLAFADAVCFDVDSTVIQEEGIDVLAEFLGKGEDVAAFTSQAMNGSMKFEDALAARLQLIQPKKSSIIKCLIERPYMLSPNIENLISLLHSSGKDVFLVSGGFRMMIEPIAKQLMIPLSNIYANTILFDDSDNDTYTGFDASEPTSADGGKSKALEMIKEKHGYKLIVMVGDGATDAQAKPPADTFIGFGGVVVREAVKEKACWFVEDFEDMIDVVQNFSDQNPKV